MQKKILLGLFIASLSAHAASSSPSKVTFESAEHIFMGDKVVLTALGQTTAVHPVTLTLSNGLQLTYGEILAMPDYYGDPQHAISSETIFKNQTQQFKKEFTDFATSDVAYFNQFWPVIQKERDAVTAALKAHEDVTAVYSKMRDSENVALAIATHFNYLTLSLTDFDHFNQDAITAYVAGHAVAIKTALNAYHIKLGQDEKVNQYCVLQPDYSGCLSTQSKNTLITAYAENAFASHFLSDRFAAGHMRNPYRALYQTRPIAILGALSGNLMHNEDNHHGVIVKNAAGKYWMAYGDDFYFSPKDKTNREMLKAVLQMSADEIADASLTGKDSDPRSEKIMALIPTPINPGETVMIDGVSVEQTAPLYQVMFGFVWQRVDVNNLYDDQWTPIWSSVLTLLTYHSNADSNVSKKWQMILVHQNREDILSRLGIDV